ncbi:MAG: glycosyltransferase family 4 protein [Acidobacteria bacterium]|nr:glycosyltransferase family 4 protein [Acidobacteriota bacterium]
MASVASLFSQVTILVPEVEPRPGGIALPPESRIVALRNPVGADLRRKLCVLSSLVAYMRQFRQHFATADVIHVPLPGDLPLLAMITALFCRKRLIARYGGSWTPTDQTTFMERVTRVCMKVMAGNRNVMLATGEASQPPALAMHWIFASAMSELELAAICPDYERALADPPRLVFIGRLSTEKGLNNLLRAMAGISARLRDRSPVLTLAGDGPERSQLKELARQSGCTDRVRFVGQIDRSKLSMLLAQMDVCVQPSLTEGYSKAWLDAMAHGLPVLASDVGAARSVIGVHGERGWRVPPGDVRALEETLCRVLIEHTDWPALRRRCRSFVEGRTLEAWAHQIGSLVASQWRCRFIGGKLG